MMIFKKIRKKKEEVSLIKELLKNPDNFVYVIKKQGDELVITIKKDEES